MVRALLTPQVVPGSLYRCDKSAFKRAACSLRREERGLTFAQKRSSQAKFGPPQFWFGFGLSYSEFRYSDLSLSAKGARGCQVVANVTVTNVGKVAAREVAQLYLNRPAQPFSRLGLCGARS